MGSKAALIHALRDEATDGRMHTAGFPEEKAVVRRYHGMHDRGVGLAGLHVFERVLEDGKPGIAGMGALHGLFELHLVTQKHEVICASSHRHGVGQGHLSGFIDEEKIEYTFPLRPGKEPSRSADNATSVGLVRGAGVFEVLHAGVAGKQGIIGVATNF